MSKKTTYSEANIQTLDWKDHIRLRAGMYIGSVDAKGFMLMLKTIFSNSFSISMADYFIIEFRGNRSASFIFKNMKRAHLDSWATDTFNSRYANHHLSLPVLNALSSEFNIKFLDKKGNQIVEQKFEKGEVKKGEVENKKLNCLSVEIDFKLDDEIWGNNLEWNTNYIIHQIKDFAYLYKNVKFEIIYKLDKEPCRIIYHFKHGLKDRIDIERLNGLIRSQLPIYFEKEFDTFSIELAFAFSSYSIDAPFLKSYANDLLTHLGGTHVKSLITGIRMALKKYVHEKKLKKKYNFSKKKITRNLIAAINLRMQSAIYSGCTRNKLGNQEIIKPLSSYISETLFDQLKTNEEEAQRLLSDFEVRERYY